MIDSFVAHYLANPDTFDCLVRDVSKLPPIGERALMETIWWGFSRAAIDQSLGEKEQEEARCQYYASILSRLLRAVAQQDNQDITEEQVKKTIIELAHISGQELDLAHIAQKTTLNHDQITELLDLFSEQGLWESIDPFGSVAERVMRETAERDAEESSADKECACPIHMADRTDQNDQENGTQNSGNLTPYQQYHQSRASSQAEDSHEQEIKSGSSNSDQEQKQQTGAQDAPWRIACSAGECDQDSSHSKSSGQDNRVTASQESKELLANSSKLPKGYFTDSGFLCYLLEIESVYALNDHKEWGHIFESFVVQELLVQTSEVDGAILSFWRTENGSDEIDLVWFYNGYLYPAEIKGSDHACGAQASGIATFQETFGEKAIDHGLLFYAGDLCDLIEYNGPGQVTRVPWHQFLSIGHKSD